MSTVRRVVIDDDTKLDVSVLPVEVLESETHRAVSQLIRAADHLQAIAESLNEHRDIDLELLTLLIAGATVAQSRADKAIKRAAYIKGISQTRLAVYHGFIPAEIVHEDKPPNLPDEVAR